MIRFLIPTKPSAEKLIARIKYIDELPHADIYSRWEADKQIMELTRKIQELAHG